MVPGFAKTVLVSLRYRSYRCSVPLKVCAEAEDNEHENVKLMMMLMMMMMMMTGDDDDDGGGVDDDSANAAADDDDDDTTSGRED